LELKAPIGKIMIRKKIRYQQKYVGILVLFYYFFCISPANTMILDENYANNGKESLLEAINKDIKEAYKISLLSVKNLEDTSNINLQITKLRKILDKDLLKNILIATNTIMDSEIDSSLKLAVINLNKLINSIQDKTDMILGGASPIAMSFYSEEIILHFEQIYNGIDNNNNDKIENENGEGCLNFINSLKDIN